MKKTILLLVAIFAMVACSKSDDNKDGGGSGSGNSSGWALKFLKLFNGAKVQIIFKLAKLTIYFNCITRLKSRGKPVFLILSLFQKLITQAIGRLRTTWAT